MSRKNLSENNRDIFPYKILERDVDEWFSKSDNSQARAGWDFLKGMTILSAVLNYGLTYQSTVRDRRRAIGFVWEDITIALRGRGDNIMTGPLLHLWVHIDSDHERQSLWETMNQALEAVQKKCEEKSYRHRYNNDHRRSPVLTDDREFTYPVAIPTSGGQLHRWCEYEGFDLDIVEEYLIFKVQEHQLEVGGDNQFSPEHLTEPNPSFTAPENVIQFTMKTKKNTD